MNKWVLSICRDWGRQVFGVKCSSASLFTTTDTWRDLGLNPVLRAKRPALIASITVYTHTHRHTHTHARYYFTLLSDHVFIYTQNAHKLNKITYWNYNEHLKSQDDDETHKSVATRVNEMRWFVYVTGFGYCEMFEWQAARYDGNTVQQVNAVYCENHTGRMKSLWAKYRLFWTPECAVHVTSRNLCANVNVLMAFDVTERRTKFLGANWTGCTQLMT
jgi:hypothetical protein